MNDDISCECLVLRSGSHKPFALICDKWEHKSKGNGTSLFSHLSGIAQVCKSSFVNSLVNEVVFYVEYESWGIKFRSLLHLLGKLRNSEKKCFFALLQNLFDSAGKLEKLDIVYKDTGLLTRFLCLH